MWTWWLELKQLFWAIRWMPYLRMAKQHDQRNLRRWWSWSFTTIPGLFTSTFCLYAGLINFHLVQFSQFSSVAQSYLTLWPHETQRARPPCPSPTPRVHPNTCPLSRWCHPTISSSCRPLLLLPSIFPSIRVPTNESALCIRWPKYWSFSFSISLSNEHPGLISFRMDWLDLLAVQGTLKNLLQRHSSKASLLHWCCSVTKSCPTLCNPVDCSTPGFPFLHYLPEFTQIHVHWVGDAIQPCHPLSSPSPPALNLSHHQGLSNESALHIRWPEYWSFSFSISLPSEYSGLISFRIDWFDLLDAQGTLKSLLQHPPFESSLGVLLL